MQCEGNCEGEEVITVKQLKEELDKYPDDARVYGYEGEATGVGIISSEGFDFLGFIETESDT